MLKDAQQTALETLHAKHIYILDRVKIYKTYLDTTSYCLGYDPEDRVAIYVNAARLVATGLTSRVEPLNQFLVHEYGHAFLFKAWDHMSANDRRRFRKIFGDYDSDGEDYENLMGDSLRALFGLQERRFNKKEFVSLYASTSPHEDWAETFSHFVYDDLPKKPGFTLATKIAYLRYLIELFGSRKDLVRYRV